jgi:hypothetical protein
MEIIFSILVRVKAHDLVFDGDFVLDSHESQSTSSGFDLVLMESFFRFS